jgi:methylphosphotriester-DNA--protein-cysteine methyltransferase
LLQEEGTTYKTVLAESREGLARYRLRRGTLRTTEVGDLLGYDDANSFQRTALGPVAHPERFKAAVAS